MAKYINADEFTHRLIGICGFSDEVDTYRVFDLLQDMLADDVVEVVRCKDCKYRSEFAGADFCITVKVTVFFSNRQTFAVMQNARRQRNEPYAP